MALVPKHQAVSDLDMYLSEVYGVINGGWEDYVSTYSEGQKVVHDPVTRAGIVHDHQIDRASTFAAIHGFNLLDFSGMKVLFIADYAIRFKKFTGDLISRNQRTKQVQKFKAQQELPGMSPTYNLEAGYVLNEACTAISNTWLIQPSGKGIHWELELTSGMAKPVIEDIFERRQEMADESETVVVRGKGEVVTLRKVKDES